VIKHASTKLCPTFTAVPQTFRGLHSLNGFEKKKKKSEKKRNKPSSLFATTSFLSSHKTASEPGIESEQEKGRSQLEEDEEETEGR